MNIYLLLQFKMKKVRVAKQNIFNALISLLSKSKYEKKFRNIIVTEVYLVAATIQKTNNIENDLCLNYKIFDFSNNFYILQ